MTKSPRLRALQFGLIALSALGLGACSVHMKAQGKTAASAQGHSAVFHTKPRVTGIKRSSKGGKFQGTSVIRFHAEGSLASGTSGHGESHSVAMGSGKAHGEGSVSAHGSATAHGSASAEGTGKGSGGAHGASDSPPKPSTEKEPAKAEPKSPPEKPKHPVATKPGELERPVEPKTTPAPVSSPSKVTVSDSKDKPQKDKPKPSETTPPKKAETTTTVPAEPPAPTTTPTTTPVVTPTAPPVVAEQPTNPPAEVPAPPPAEEPTAAPEEPIEPPETPPENVFGYEKPIRGCFEGIVYPLRPRSRQLPLQYDALKPISVVYACEWDIPTREWKTGFPGIPDHFEWFAIRYSGSFFIEQGGEWAFRISSDDGTKLFIDGKPVIFNDGIHPPREASAKVKLEPGDHEMVLEYFQGPRFLINLQLFATPPGGEEGIFSVR